MNPFDLLINIATLDNWSETLNKGAPLCRPAFAKSTGGSHLSHKYLSKRPDGKGGYVYTYKREDGTTYTTGEKPQRAVQQWLDTIRGARARLKQQMAAHPEGGTKEQKDRLARLAKEEAHAKEHKAAGRSHAPDMDHGDAPAEKPPGLSPKQSEPAKPRYIENLVPGRKYTMHELIEAGVIANPADTIPLVQQGILDTNRDRFWLRQVITEKTKITGSFGGNPPPKKPPEPKEEAPKRPLQIRLPAKLKYTEDRIESYLSDPKSFGDDGKLTPSASYFIHDSLPHHKGLGFDSADYREAAKLMRARHYALDDLASNMEKAADRQDAKEKADAEANEAARKHREEAPLSTLTAQGHSVGPRVAKLVEATLASKDLSEVEIAIGQINQAIGGARKRAGEWTTTYGRVSTHEQQARDDAKHLTSQMHVLEAHKKKLQTAEKTKATKAHRSGETSGGHVPGTVKDGKIHLAVGRASQIVEAKHIAGEWAVHDDEKGKFGVTHVGTGLRVKGQMSAREAKQLADHMHTHAPDGLPGVKFGSMPDRGQAKHVSQAMKYWHDRKNTRGGKIIDQNEKAKVDRIAYTEANEKAVRASNAPWNGTPGDKKPMHHEAARLHEEAAKLAPDATNKQLHRDKAAHHRKVAEPLASREEGSGASAAHERKLSVLNRIADANGMRAGQFNDPRDHRVLANLVADGRLTRDSASGVYSVTPSGHMLRGKPRDQYADRDPDEDWGHAKTKK